MTKRRTQYYTAWDLPIYSENGEFYYTQNNGATWRQLQNMSHYYSVLGRYNDPTASLKWKGYIRNLKGNYNRAARTIQRVVRKRRKAATTIQRRVRGVQLRARAGWNNPFTPVGYLAMMKRLMRMQKEMSAHNR
jgi:hypothetical protein